MLEILSWWSLIYRGKKGLFREDDNETMESQQSTCYSEPQKTPTKNLTKLKRKKEFSQLNTTRREKATQNIEQGNIYSFTFIALSKTGLGVYSREVRMTAQYHQCLHEVATNLR